MLECMREREEKRERLVLGQHSRCPHLHMKSVTAKICSTKRVAEVYIIEGLWNREISADSTGSVIMRMKSRAQYIYMYVDVFKYIYILPLFVYSTPLACWERACVDEVACSLYV